MAIKFVLQIIKSGLELSENITIYYLNINARRQIMPTVNCILLKRLILSS